MIEQPLPAEDLLGARDLQEALSTPLCLDETAASPAWVRQALELRAGSILNLKPGRVGGLTAALEIHHLCYSAGVPLWIGGMLETGIGRAFNVALAARPGVTLPGDLSPSDRYWTRDIVDPPWTMDPHGRVQVPLDRSGLGVRVDRERIEALTVRRAELLPGS